MMTIRAAFITDIGRRRAQNQDSGGSFPEHGIFIVADGMGGHRGGEVASKIAVQTIHDTMIDELSDGASPSEALSLGTNAANRNILDRAKKEPELEGMGTTTTSLHFGPLPEPKRAWIGHVGDSRCYLIKEEGIWQLTRDHSLVQEKLRAGMITREQLKTDRMKNVITRSVGFDLHFGIDIYEFAPEAGDLFLICSDGLSGPLEDSDIFETTQKFYFTPLRNAGLTPATESELHDAFLKSTVEALISGANERGGDDNITALIARFPGKTK